MPQPPLADAESAILRLIQRVVAPAALLALALTSPTAVLAWDAGPVACKNTAQENCSDDRGNTHLWIVDNALELLKTSTDPRDAAIVAALDKAACRTEWEQGLWEMDCNAEIAGCSGDETQFGDPPAVGTHFYNDNGKDYFGNANSCQTYELAETCVSTATARVNAGLRMQVVKDLSAADSCRNLGRALHYFTDTTMPFHASSLSGGSLFLNLLHPTKLLHPTWENWVGTKHGGFPQSGNWKKTGLSGSADELLGTTSKQSFTHLPPYFAAMHLSDSATGRLWSTDRFPDTTQSLGPMLHDAYQVTASYLHLALVDKVSP